MLFLAVLLLGCSDITKTLYVFSGRVLFLDYSDVTEKYYVFSGRVLFPDYSDVTEKYYVFSGRVLFLGCMTLPKRTMLPLGMLFIEYNTITEACCVVFRTCAIPSPVTGH